MAIKRLLMTRTKLPTDLSLSRLNRVAGHPDEGADLVSSHRRRRRITSPDQQRHGQWPRVPLDVASRWRRVSNVWLSRARDSCDLYP